VTVEPARAASDTAPNRPNQALAFLRCLRPKQFIKNLLIFTPGLFSAKVSGRWLLNGQVFVSLAETFALFSIVAGCTYVLNDFVDLERDRKNPDKKRRPMAAGHISPTLALGLAALLLSAALGEQFLRSPHVAYGFLAYLVITLSYSFWLKRMVIIDIMTIAGLFVLRAYIGCLDMNVPLSMWFLSCIGWGALLIGTCKRHHEYKLVAKGIVGGESARSVMKEYNDELLLLLMAVSTVGALLTYTFFTLNEAPPAFGFSIPFIIFGLFRFLYLALVRGVAGTPEVTLMRDTPLLITLALWTATILFVYKHAVS
jgi:4-hydroxybenzoate polyprenyltransferase